MLTTTLSRGRPASPFTAREVYRNEWTGLTEPRVVQGALECFEEVGWIRPEAVRAPDGGRFLATVMDRCRGGLPRHVSGGARAA